MSAKFNKEELDIGVDYCKKQFFDGKNLYDILKIFDIPSSWYRHGSIICLDELKLFKDDENGLTNLKFRVDLENLVKTGSCYGLGFYIYQLLEYIQEVHEQD